MSDVRVTKSLDTATGLDEQAMAAARGWLFQPATLNGEPVRVSVGLMIEFRLH